MRVEALGDAAWTLRDLDEPAWVLAERIRNGGVPGILDASASYDTVGVYSEPGAIDEARLAAAIAALERVEMPAPRTHEIPVCYEMGEDSTEVCERLGLKLHEMMQLHTAQDFECFAVGFCPGFGYLGWLPERLAGVPRRASPRTRVQAGSVAITGRQTAVYPLDRPGGWALIGRTPLTLVDVEDGYFPISAGDRVHFHAIDAPEFGRLEGERL